MDVIKYRTEASALIDRGDGRFEAFILPPWFKPHCESCDCLKTIGVKKQNISFPGLPGLKAEGVGKARVCECLEQGKPCKETGEKYEVVDG